MNLSQVEADRLLHLPKTFAASVNEIDFSISVSFKRNYDLFEIDGREKFLLDLERSRIRTAKLKIQTRARSVFVLARLDINGTPHPNPPNSIHRPGERLVGTHIHLYHEGFADRIAYLPQDVPAFASLTSTDDLDWLVAFLRFSGVQTFPQIQRVIV